MDGDSFASQSRFEVYARLAVFPFMLIILSSVQQALAIGLKTTNEFLNKGMTKNTV